MKTIKIKVFCHTGYAGCNHDYIEEIEEEEWNRKSAKQKEKFLDELARDNMGNSIDFGAYVIDESEENPND